MVDLTDIITAGATGGFKTRWVEIFRISLNSSNASLSGNYVVSGGYRKMRVTVQGPSACGRRAPAGPPILSGPGGGAGGRARKVYAVNPGDVFPYVVGGGGQTEGASGQAATTFGSGANQMVANVGSGASVVTAVNSGGGAGGTATGGDENATGGRGGHTNAVAGTQQVYGVGASGGGAPMLNALGVLVDGLPGKAGREDSAFYSGTGVSSGVHIGGGGGGFYKSDGSYLAPMRGFYGGGGGGGCPYATTQAQTSYYFAVGSSGWISVEIEQSYVPSRAIRKFGVQRPIEDSVLDANASSWQYTAGSFCATPIEVKGGLMLSAGIGFEGASQDGLRFGLYDATSRLLIKEAVSSGVTSASTIILSDFAGVYLDDGVYFLAAARKETGNAPTVKMLTQNAALSRYFGATYGLYSAGPTLASAGYLFSGSVFTGSFYEAMPSELPIFEATDRSPGIFLS